MTDTVLIEKLKVFDANDNEVLDSNLEFKNSFMERFNLPMELINSEAITNAYYSYEKVQSMAKTIEARINARPLVAVICGSGLGAIADRINNPLILPYTDIPDFPRSTVLGHKGNLIFGEISGLPVVCMQGRFHPYEGYSLALCTLPIRIFKLLGCKAIILTNACGGINESYKIGDLMIIKDHLSFPMLSLQHPLVGPNDDRFGPRFLPVNNIYCKELRDALKQTSAELNLEMREGVYGSIGGPTYETVSDIRYMKLLGMDVVGMSTTHEAVVALHCGLKVLAFSIITDMAISEFDSTGTTNHEEIVKVANSRSKDAEELVVQFLAKLKTSPELIE